MRNRYKIVILLFLLLKLTVIKAEAQIQNKFFGEWEYKGPGESKDEPNNNIHIIFEFKSDGAVLFSGYINKRKMILYGKVVKNLGVNKVSVSYYKFRAGRIKERFKYESLEEITIVPLSSDSIKIITVFLPTEFNPEPQEDEYVFTRKK